MPLTTERSEERIVLHNVSWRTYESLLKDFESSSAPRFTYDRGTLEIMSPLPRHEGDNRNLAQVVEVLAEEWGVDVINLGSTTFKRADLERGFEPDSCFYIQNAERIAGKEDIDLVAGDPAPDLVIEIDRTHSSFNKLPLFAQMGVPEVWRVTDDQGVTILDRTHGTYEAREVSQVLPPLSRAILQDFLIQSRTLRRLEWLRCVREWARQNSHQAI